MSDLPIGWAWTTLHEVCERSATHDPKHRPEESFTYIDIGGISGNRIAETKAVLGSDAPSRARQVVKAGDTVLSTVRTYLKKTALVPPELDGATASTGFCVLRPVDGVDARFIFYRVLEDGFVSELSKRQTGSSYPAVRDTDVFEQPIMLPPLNEQQSIVAAIEEHLSRLDAAVASTDSCNSKLNALRRASILAGFDGDWPLVPIGSLGDGSRHALAIGPFGSNLKVSDYTASGVPLIFVRDIRSRVFGGPGSRFISAEKAQELAAHLVRPGDLLVTKMGDPPGDAAVYPSSRPEAVLTADCIKVTPSEAASADFLALTFKLPSVVSQIAGITKGVAQPKVSLARFKEVRVPLPRPEEQQRIVAEIAERFSAIDGLHSALERAQRRSASLRRAVLERAFRGELVPHDPTDEPALALLERIRAGQPEAAKRARRRGVSA